MMCFHMAMSASATWHMCVYMSACVGMSVRACVHMYN